MFQQMVEDRYLALAENVRANRERLGWGQPELARASGVSIGTISRIENGKHEGRNHTIRQLADAFDVRFDELLPAMPQPAEHDSQLDRIEAKLDQALSAQAEIHAALGELLSAAGRRRVKAATGRAAARSRQRRATDQEDPPGRQAGGQAS